MRFLQVPWHHKAHNKYDIQMKYCLKRNLKQHKMDGLIDYCLKSSTQYSTYIQNVEKNNI